MRPYNCLSEIEEIKLRQAQLLRNECLKTTSIANIKETIHFETKHITQNQNIFPRRYVQCL